MGQLRLESDEQAAAILDRVLAAAQRNIEYRMGRSCGAATVVSHHRGLWPGRPEFLPDSSTASIAVEYWKSGAWLSVACSLVEGVPPIFYPNALTSPDHRPAGEPNCRVTATTAWAVPSDVKQAILLKAEVLWHLDQQMESNNAAATEAAIDSLIAPYKPLEEIAA